MDKSHKYLIEWKKSDKKEFILYDSIPYYSKANEINLQW